MTPRFAPDVRRRQNPHGTRTSPLVSILSRMEAGARDPGHGARLNAASSAPRSSRMERTRPFDGSSEHEDADMPQSTWAHFWRGRFVLEGRPGQRVGAVLYWQISECHVPGRTLHPTRRPVGAVNIHKNRMYSS